MRLNATGKYQCSNNSYFSVLIPSDFSLFHYYSAVLILSDINLFHSYSTVVIMSDFNLFQSYSNILIQSNFNITLLFLTPSDFKKLP